MASIVQPTKEMNMPVYEDLWKQGQAAEYLRLDVKYLMRMCRKGSGPVYLQPSPKRILFRKSDLDAWRAGWIVKQPSKMARTLPINSEAKPTTAD